MSIPSNPERDRQVWELHRPARDCAGAASAARYAVLEATGAHAGAQEIKHEARLNSKASWQRWVEQKLQNPNRNKASHVFSTMLFSGKRPGFNYLIGLKFNFHIIPIFRSCSFPKVRQAHYLSHGACPSRGERLIGAAVRPDVAAVFLAASEWPLCTQR